MGLSHNLRTFTKIVKVYLNIKRKYVFGLMIFFNFRIKLLGSAILIMYNLKFTEITPFGLSFAQSVFLLQTILFVSAPIGGMTLMIIFLNFHSIKILQIDSGLLIVIGICGWINGLEIIF